jgi:hypothetical protein
LKWIHAKCQRLIFGQTNIIALLSYERTEEKKETGTSGCISYKEKEDRESAKESKVTRYYRPKKREKRGRLV